MMWIICMFDVPVRTKTEMRKATRFRNLLLDNGFVMKQFSVYIKPVKSLSVGQTTTKKLAKFIPDNSSVSFIYITDKQYLMTENYLGKNFEENEEEIDCCCIFGSMCGNGNLRTRQRGFRQCIYRGEITGAGVAAEAEYDNSRSIWNSG